MQDEIELACCASSSTSGDYGLDDFYLELSTKPEGKAAGTDEEWDEATEALRQVASSPGLELVLDEGGGAFYGPKISVQARDAIGRTWQMSTVQLDFQLPAALRPGVHRRRQPAPHAGDDPPRSVRVGRAVHGRAHRALRRALSRCGSRPSRSRAAGERRAHEDYAAEVVASSWRRRASASAIDDADEPLGNRIRKAKLEKLPYMLVVGDDDVAQRTSASTRVAAKSSAV